MLLVSRITTGATRSRRARLITAALAATVVASPAVAFAANDSAFSAHVPFSGGRSTDLRAGEPLEFAFKGEKISKVCWTPAPIQRSRCGTDLAAPVKAGTQKLRVTLKNGHSYSESLTIGARATHLAATIHEAGASSARVVEYRATCNADGYDNYAGGKLKGQRNRSNMKKGDLLAAFYRAGPHAIQALRYSSPVPAFYNDHCLTPVK